MVIEDAKRVLRIERDAISALIDRIDDNFVKAVEILDECHGRVVVTGMGKSGIIGKKIAATLASIGVPAFFLHPAEGVHGDLGMLTRGDVVIGISNSGQTEELLTIIPSIKRFGLKMISMTGKMDSPLAKLSDITLNLSVKEEACPWDLVPTSSTTATLAMGDAIAIALLHKKGIKEDDFATFHPGGSIGTNLLLKVSDLMIQGDNVPIVLSNASIGEIEQEISSKKKGVTAVVDSHKALVGLIADGDLRRHLTKGKNLFDLTAKDIMSPDPKTIKKDELAARGVKIMEEFAITSLMVVEENSRPTGLIHLHDILKAGIV